MGDFSSEVISHIDKSYVRDVLAKGERIDGRAFDEYRPIEIEYDVVAAKAEGSALVRLGNTSVIAGIKVGLGSPYADTPDAGVTMVTAEMTPLASPLFELGPPKEGAIELARVVDRGVRESETVDVKQLVVEPGKMVYMVFCDIYALEFDGNLIDASSIAVNAALLTAKYNKYVWEDDKAVMTDEKIPVPLQNISIECTIVKIDDFLIIDPTLKEEMVQDTRLTVAIDKDDYLTAMQKGGRAGPMAMNHIDSSVDMAHARAKDIRELIQSTAKERENE